MGAIRMNYDAMSAAAADIAGCAGDTRAALAAIEKSAAALAPLWQGRARAAFDPAYAACIGELRHVPLMLDQIGAALRATAQTIQLAENRARGAIETVVVDDGAGAGA